MMHHGAGSAAFSFALLVTEIRRLLPEAGIIAPDARGHGETVVNTTSGDERPLDLSLAALSNDLVEVIRLTQHKLGWSEVPGMVFVGHSLGGAVVANVAKGGVYADKLLGYAVLDVVEGELYSLYLCAFVCL